MANLQQQARQQLIKQGLLPNKDAKALTKPHKRGNAERIVSILRMTAQGHTQRFIAEQLGITQGAVSQTLTKYGRNTTKDARQILEARAADMALNIIRNGRPADQVQVLKGFKVIPEDAERQAGLNITINGFALVGLGLSPSTTSVQGEGDEKAQQIAAVSDSSSYVNEANSLIIEDIPDQERKTSEANPGAGLDGGPATVGKG